MEYWNLHRSVLETAEFVGSDPVERGTWVCLQGYCIGQENGGVIEDCGWWKDRHWQQTVRVTLKEVRSKSRLWEWQGNDLHVFFYPVEAEEKVKAKRETARINGKAGGRPKKNPRETHAKPILVISEKAKGNGMEGNENIPPHPPIGGASEGVDLVKLSKSLRPEWQASPLLSAREARPFAKNEQLLALFPSDAWEVMREFLAARLPEGSALFQPVLLQKFLDNPGGVLGQAQAWKRNQRPKFEVVKVPAEPPSAEDAAALAEFLKKPLPQRMNS